MKSIGDQIRTARQQRHLSQSALARQVGCKQSALSMYESGRTTALSAPMVGKLCNALGLIPPTDVELSESASVASEPEGVRTFCPNPECPSNLPITIGDRVALLPKGHFAREHDLHCTWCGEVLERACPECGATVSEGAFCSHCGKPYLAVVPAQLDSKRVTICEHIASWAHAH